MLKDYINNKPTIESERLILRPLVKDDVEDLREWTPNKAIYKYWGKNPGKADLKPELLFEKAERPSKSFHLGIELKENKKIIGDIYIYLIERDKKAKVAIRLNPEYHNKKIGTEAVKTMTEWCFANTELQTIWSDVDKENIASIKLLEKCKFKRVKEVSQGKMVSTICDYFIYELCK
ncbi:MAG: GNAT family N-acetyltransferase [Clostridia bacterium]|nr:GNAT family N-acetyltransferase [Clostridia bacterium]